MKYPHLISGLLSRFRSNLLKLNQGIGKSLVDELSKKVGEYASAVSRSAIYLQSCNRHWNLFTEDKLQEDLVEGEVDDSRIQHGLGYKLTNNLENVSAFPAKRTHV